MIASALARYATVPPGARPTSWKSTAVPYRGPGLTNWRGAKLGVCGAGDGLAAVACGDGVTVGRATAPQAVRVSITTEDSSQPCRITYTMQPVSGGDGYTIPIRSSRCRRTVVR